MIRTKTPRRDRFAASASLLAAACYLAASQQVQGQAASPASASQAAPADEEVIELSPFEVNSTEDSGYTATSTLAGTRVRTNLEDLASPLSVVTPKFLQDTGARNNLTLLTYTTSTEVGGLYGNYGGFGNGQGLSETGALLRPNNNTRVRGLESADSTRNFFLSDIPWDSYNTDRIEIQRGPNSILFGVGSPSGIINNNTHVANVSKSGGKVEAETGSFRSLRASVDYNQVIVKNLLAVRVDGLDSRQRFRQEQAFNNDKRAFGTLTYTPQLFPKDWASPMNIRLNAEVGHIKSKNPRVLPPVDKISLWFASDNNKGANGIWGMNKKVYDSYLMEAGGFGNVQRGLNGSVKDAYYVPAYQAMDGGALNNGGVGFFWDYNNAAPIFISRQSPRDYPFSIQSDGNIGGNAIAGFPYGSPLMSTGWNNYAKLIDWYDTNHAKTASRFPLAQRNYYKDRVLTDPTIFDFYNQMIDGRNGTEWNKWNAYNVSLNQGFLDNRFALEAVYDYQTYSYGRDGFYMDNPYIAVDANITLLHQMPQYSRVPDPTGTQAQGIIDLTKTTYPNGTNPNAGRALVSGEWGNLSNSSLKTERESVRLTGTAELRSSDVFEKGSFLQKVLGLHRLTGLYSEEEVTTSDKQWLYAATTLEWAESLATDNTDTRLGQSYRSLSPFIYLSGDLRNRAGNSASGLNLNPVSVMLKPSGSYNIHHFDSHWKYPLDPSKPGYVNPAATFTNMFGEIATGNGGADGTQAENPANYVGWTTKPGTILNAEDGAIAQLMRENSVRYNETESMGLTWQAELLGGSFVPTWGWRRDRLKYYNGSSSRTAEDVAVGPKPLELADDTTGETRSWGAVLKMPRSWADKLPLKTRLNAYYNRGNNQRVAVRYNFDGQRLVNPTARGTDYGIVLSTLEDRLTVKLGKFKVEAKNVDLPGGASLIGGNQYYISQLEAWGTAIAVNCWYGQKGLDPGREWYWNYAHVDAGWTADTIDPNGAAFKTHPSTIKQTAAIKDMIENIDENFFKAYQIPVDVKALKAAFAANNVEGVKAAFGGNLNPGAYTTALNSPDSTKINGVTTNGTIDNLSEGYELEINARPLENWDFQINIAKTDSSRSSLGAPMLSFINKQYKRFSGPAGDLRVWWGGDNPIKKYYEDNILSALKFQEESVGHQVPELRPWRASLVSNYSFRKGFLKDVNVGGAYRWEDKAILGYGLKKDNSGLDVNKPFKGPDETSVDLWMGYQRKIAKDVTWRIQLNLRNVGEDVGLVPISVNPDGTYAAQRIQEGMTWHLTNTFSF